MVPEGGKSKDERDYILQKEEALLSPLAMRSSMSRGRAVPEPPCEVRTDFQRDRDRILHSKAFRRLSHKTQVFIAPEGDHFRTRLTHTLEVAQIARTISRALGLNEDLTEAIALGHDLGHTPFGHMGERILDRIVRDSGSPDGFRHQLQSVRVVEVLENDGRGLNLTFETIDGIRHHSKGLGDYDPGDIGDDPSTFEGRVVKLADRIAYVSHDLEDAFRAGLVRESDVPTLFVGALGETSRNRINAMVLDVVAQSRRSKRLCISDEIMDAINRLKDFLYGRVYEHPKVKAEEERIRSVLKGIFQKLFEDGQASVTYLGRWDEDESSRRVMVADYISGCTDRFAMMIFERMFVPGFWRLEF